MVGGDIGIILFLEIAMLVWCEFVWDLYTREVVSLAVSESTTFSKTKAYFKPPSAARALADLSCWIGRA
jgi:hypothetical protein